MVTATLAEARRRYFDENAFGDDGGYSSKWVDFKLGPIPFPFPNSAERVRAVQFHDLHHIVTGYRTDFIGELEIAAFEIGGGCGDMLVAWILNLSGMAAGFVLAPRRIMRAFVRGRRSRTLYRHTFGDALLARTVDDVREELGIDRDPRPMTAGEIVAALLYGAIGWIVGTILFWTIVPLAPFGALALNAAKRRATTRREPVSGGAQ